MDGGAPALSGRVPGRKRNDTIISVVDVPMTSSRFFLALATTGFFLRTASHAGAQLTLRDAFAEAGRAGYTNRIAAGNTAAQRAQTLAPLKGILPNVRVEAGYIRTTDPIGVFGATLRQRAVTQANFDPAAPQPPERRRELPDGHRVGAAPVERRRVDGASSSGVRRRRHACGRGVDTAVDACGRGARLLRCRARGRARRRASDGRRAPATRTSRKPRRW